MNNKELIAGIISGAVAVTAGLYLSSGKSILQKTLADAGNADIPLPDKLNNLFDNLLDGLFNNDDRQTYQNESPSPGLNVFSEPGLLL